MERDIGGFISTEAGPATTAATINEYSSISRLDHAEHVYSLWADEPTQFGPSNGISHVPQQGRETRLVPYHDSAIVSEHTTRLDPRFGYSDPIIRESTVKDNNVALSKLHHCSICAKYFPLKKTRDRHLRTVHFRANYQCASCNEDFKRKDIRDRHEREQHGDKKGTVRCPICSREVRARAIDEDWRSSACQQAQDKADAALIETVTDEAGRSGFGVGSLYPALHVIDSLLVSAYTLKNFLKFWNCKIADEVSTRQIEILEQLGVSMRLVRKAMRQEDIAQNVFLLDASLALSAVESYISNHGFARHEWAPWLRGMSTYLSVDCASLENVITIRFHLRLLVSLHCHTCTQGSIGMVRYRGRIAFVASTQKRYHQSHRW